MNKLAFAAVLLVVALAAQNVEGAKDKKKPPVQVKEGSFSDQDHFHDGKHDSKYDHDAFLGEDQAREMSKLSPKETKKRLRALFVKMDVDGDKKLSRKELTDWIVDNMKKHVSKNTKLRMKELDKNKDGKISWDEYAKEEYNLEGLSDSAEDKKLVEDMKTRDQKRFKVADSDDDGLLDEEELALFTHPEESARMTNVIVQENIEQLDKDGDGKVNFEEYYGADDSEGMKDDGSLESLKDTFNKELDKNHDGVLDNDEIRAWLMPGGEVDPASGEADHLMKEADLNKDNYLTVEEIIKNHELFSGSRMTAYGDLLKGKNEL